MNERDILEGLIAIATAAQQKGWEKKEAEIEHAGTKITLPAQPTPMGLPTAISQLEKKMAEEETEMTFSRTYDAFVIDGALAFNHALKAVYGWATPVVTPPKSFFQGPQKPNMMTVQVGYRETGQLIFGSFELPNVPGRFETEAVKHDGQWKFQLTAVLKNKYSELFNLVANKTQEVLDTQSIYLGNSFALRTEKGELSLENPPVFLPKYNNSLRDLILNDDIMAMVQGSILNMVQHTQACRDLGVPLKRGILLEGPFGVGKTMIAHAVSNVCTNNGWTFVLIDSPKGLSDALKFCKQFINGPTVVFCEDVDRIEDSGEKTTDLQNVIDGIVSKDSEIMTIMTTNFVHKINPAMLRPGRFDDVIHIDAPNAESVNKLLRQYARGLIDKDEDLTEACELLSGQIPATIREVVERSKLQAIPDYDPADPRTMPVIKSEHVIAATLGMQNHLRLLEAAMQPREVDPEIQFFQLFEQIVSNFNQQDRDHAAVTQNIARRTLDQVS